MGTIILNGISASVEEGAQAAVSRALDTLSLPSGQIVSAQLVKTSVDARRGQVRFVCSVAVELTDAGLSALTSRGKPLRFWQEPAGLNVQFGSRMLAHRPVVIGFGPAGIFSALLLAQNGYRPIVLERGASVDDRVKAVEGFWAGGALDVATNVQFGEGGAGTFSDGKLTTRINDPLCAYVLRELVRYGAPKDILVRAKPHIGTDQLRGVVKRLREEILRLGGEVRFLTAAEHFRTGNGALRAIQIPGGELPADAAIVAIGHSARDTFEALSDCGATILPKAFSVGVRIEHLQAAIDRAMYGSYAEHPHLPHGEYQLSHREGTRAAYTFCMCPGGTVVAAASENGQVVTNGMSCYARDLPNANAALAVSVGPEDFGFGWRDGIAFQRQLEAAAFSAGGKTGAAPITTVGQLLSTSKKSPSVVQPSYPIGVKEISITEMFPPQISEMLVRSLPILGRQLRGFDAPEAVLTGVETRTSSPVRVVRGEDGAALGLEGLYPCGEGAGYAGGIMSAAVDGLHCALALMAHMRAPKHDLS